MPETTFTRRSQSGWPGASRRDLPARNAQALVQNGALSDRPLALLEAAGGGNPSLGMPPARGLVYQYVDTGFSAIHASNVLWSDSASWCTIVTLWRMGMAGLAHIVPGSTARQDVRALLGLFGPTPTEIHLATTPVHFDRDEGFVSVRAAIAEFYGDAYDGIHVFLVNGYNNRDWAQQHQLAVDPRSGAYPVFND